MCHHLPRCPGADRSDRDAARVVAAHPEQGWSLLCNGVVLFEDTGELLPDGAALAPHGRCGPPAGRVRPATRLRRYAAGGDAGPARRLLPAG